MTRKTAFIFSLLTMMMLVVLPSITAAQDDESQLVCDAFTDSSDDVRTGYYMGEGAGFLNAGQYLRAIDSFSCIIEQIDADYVDAYTNRAIAHFTRRNYDAALEDYTSALELRSSFAAAYNNRGIVYAALEEYESAIADFDQAIASSSNAAFIYNNRAVVHTIVGNFDAAIADLEEAISISGVDDTYATIIETNPDELPQVSRADATSYALLGIVYSAQALDSYNRYLTLTGSSADFRIQGAASALDTRFTFELRLADGTWLLTASVAD